MAMRAGACMPVMFGEAERQAARSASVPRDPHCALDTVYSSVPIGTPSTSSHPSFFSDADVDTLQEANPPPPPKRVLSGVVPRSC